MQDNDLRTQVLSILGLTDSAADIQEEALAKVTAIAEARIARLIPNMLTQEQLQQIEDMRSAGKNEEEITAWVEQNIPDYPGMIQAALLDVADEAAGN
jgi:hypothetical protein